MTMMYNFDREQRVRCNYLTRKNECIEKLAIATGWNKTHVLKEFNDFFLLNRRKLLDTFLFFCADKRQVILLFILEIAHNIYQR